MADKILSPDGKQEWNGTSWVPISDIAPTSISGTDQKTETIVNYANLCIDSLSRVDMAAAKTYYGKAKEVDLKIAKRIFEGEYGADIGKEYADIVETYLVGIIRTKFSSNMKHIGMGIVNWDIDGDFEMDHKLQNLDVAFNNAVAFLGDPFSMIKGGIDSVLTVRIMRFDENADGIPDYEQRKLSREESLSIAETPMTKDMIEEIEFIGVPNEEVLKQQFRIGLILESAGAHILSILNPLVLQVIRTDSTGVTVKFLMEKQRNAAEAMDKGRNFQLGATALALGADLPIDEWKTDDFELIQTLLKDSKKAIDKHKSEVNANLERAITQKQTSECFIATAAYGTPYDSKIDVLRNWRDDSLKSSILGRIFIRNYYFFSPPIASIVAKSSALRGIVRLILSPIIHLLKPKYSRPRNSRS